MQSYTREVYLSAIKKLPEKFETLTDDQLAKLHNKVGDLVELVDLYVMKNNSNKEKKIIIEEAAKICGRKWKTLAPNMNYLHKKHIPIKGTQKEMFAFINDIMGIRAEEIIKLATSNESRANDGNK